jgi:hypothetical protein
MALLRRLVLLGMMGIILSSLPLPGQAKAQGVRVSWVFRTLVEDPPSSRPPRVGGPAAVTSSAFDAG